MIFVLSSFLRRFSWIRPQVLSEQWIKQCQLCFGQRWSLYNNHEFWITIYRIWVLCHVPPSLAGCARRSSGCHHGCTWSCRSGQTHSRCPPHVGPEFPPGWWSAESEGQSAKTHSCSLDQSCSLDTTHHPLPLSPVYTAGKNTQKDNQEI